MSIPRALSSICWSGLAVALAFTAALTGGGAQARAQTVQFEVQFVEVRENGNWRRPVPRKVAVTLTGGNQIRASESVGRRGGRQQESQAVLGKTYRLYDDRGAMGEWQVGSSNTLVRRAQSSSDTEILTLRSIGETSCSASVGYVLLPGRTRFYRRNGIFDRIVAEDVSCRILSRSGT